MRSYLLLSILVFLIGAPAVVAREPSARRAIKKLMLLFAAYCVLYWLALLYLYPRLS